MQRLLLLAAMLVLLPNAASASSPLHDMRLHDVSLRMRVGGERVIGVEQPERFESVDLGFTWRLPWQRYGASGWGAGTRLLGSVGWMTGAEDSALVLSAIPLLAFGSVDGRFTADMGLGGALLSRHRFDQQNYGGHFQFALTVGLSVPLYRDIGIGYRFMHYSDAAMYGPHSIGADFHMVELSYRF